MQKKSTFTKILILVIGFVIIGGLTEFLNFISISAESKNLEYIPNEAVLKLRINGKSLIGKTANSVLFDAKNDPKFLTQIDTLLQQTLKNKEESENNGINFLSEIGVFGVEDNGLVNLYVLVNIKNKNQFIESFKKKGSTNYALNSDGDVALIAIQSGLASQNVNSFKKFLSKKSNFKFDSFDFENDITLVTAAPKNNLLNLGSGKLNGKFDDDKFTFTGKIKSNLPFHPVNYSLVKSGLHYTLQDPASLKQFNMILKMLNPTLPNIQHIGLNYRGVSLKEGGNPYFAEPDLDLLISFDNAINPALLLENINKFNELGFRYENEELFAGKSKFVIKLIDDKHLFIGKNEKNLLNKSNPNLVEFDGKPEILTNITGPDYITSFFEVMTPFAAAKSYLSSIENTNLVVTKTDIKGSVVFKKNKNSFIEIIRLMLILKGIQ